MIKKPADADIARTPGLKGTTRAAPEVSEDRPAQPGSRGAYLISETMNEMACRMWDAYTDPESNGIDQDDASQLALQVSAAYLEERQGVFEDPGAGPGPR